jgi:GNAT superfamily N-acetyltransferase
VEIEILAWPSDGPKLRLDHERFAYAGKFVMTNTGKAVARERPHGVGVHGVEADAADDDVRDEAVDGGDDAPEEGGADRVHEANGEERILAAAAFNADRTDSETLWLRYVTVARERRGDGIGPRLCAFVAGRALDRGYERVRIAVNNPYAYEALYKAGFGFTGEETGIAELVLERPGDRSTERYRAGLSRFRDRDLTDEESAFLDARRGTGPPAIRDEN